MSRSSDTTGDYGGHSDHWRNWFEDSPIAMTFEDWSQVKRVVDRLRDSGVKDISSHIGEHPEVLAEIAPAARILDANAAAVSMYKAGSKQELLDGFNAPLNLHNFDPATGLSYIYLTLIDRFSAGETRVELEGPDTTLEGSHIYTRTTTSIALGHEDDWGKVLQITEDITSKKKAEDALRESEAQLQDAIDSLSEGLALYDADDRLVMWNSRYQEFHDDCRGVLIDGSHWLDVHRNRIQRGFFQGGEEGIPLQVAREVEQRMTNGNMEFWTATGRCIESSCRLTQQGGFISTWRDITRQKQAQNALAESEALLAQSAVIANLGYAVWDCIEEKYITVSKGWAGIFGYSEGEFLSTFTDAGSDGSLVHPADQDRYRTYFDTDLGEQATDIEYRIIRRDGRIRHVLQRHKHVAEQGTSLLSIQDITERKLVEEEMRKSHALYRQAEVMGKLGHWTWDHKNDRMDSCSEQFARIYEMSVAEAISFFSDMDNILSVVHPDDRERYNQVKQECSRQLKGMDTQFRIVTRSGAIRHIHLLSELLLDDQNRPLKSFGTEQDITERKELSEELAYRATHDALTGLINRSEFDRRLRRVLESARNGRGEHALCYLDLDQFKVINDTCGHVAGDELLRQLSQLLTTCLRERDTLARLGGDEFGVLMEHCPIGRAREVANKVRKAVAGFRFVWDGRAFHVGVSIGLVPVNEVSESAFNVLSAADSACYAAKDEGRNRVHVFDLDDTGLAKRRGEMQWVARLEKALEEERFQLWVQRITPLAAPGEDGERFELLLRLMDESGEIIMPRDFLPAAERYGLASKIDRWVIGRALAWLGRGTTMLNRVSLCSINLSGTSLADEDFLRLVQRRLARTRIPAHKICFEITEVATIANLSRAMTFMKALSQQGCQFALDDFGSGLSSFAYLKTLPVHYLKIDGTFVKDILGDEVDLALVRAINDVGKVMGKQTIAKFVESDTVLGKLREIGVDYAQGHAIGRAVPISEIPSVDTMDIQTAAGREGR